MNIKHEMEIGSTYFEKEEDTNDDVLNSQKADKKRARCIAEKLKQLKIELNDIPTNHDDAKIIEIKACLINKQMTDLINEYMDIDERLSKLVQSVSFDRHTEVNNESTVTKDNEGLHNCPRIEIPIILVKDSKETKLFNYYEQRNDHTINNDESFYSCTGGSEENVCSGSVESPMTDICYELSEKMDAEYEKEVVRDDLMATMGEVKLLHQQNRDLLSQLNATNQRAAVLSNTLRNKPYHVVCQEDGKRKDTCENTETKLDSRDLTSEIKRLRNELNEMKRDRCQIELARKILNISDSQCANCMGSTDRNDNDKIKLEELTNKFNCLLAESDTKSKEVTDLRKELDAIKYDSKTYKDNLVISKTRITLLEKELFDLKSAKSHDTEVARSNDKYLIENLKHNLFETKAEINNMQMIIDHHQTELKNKRDKYMEVLQTHHEQKNHIETLYKEKSKIAKEYEDEFNRMDSHLKARLEEIVTLPAELASVQEEFEKEKLARMALEVERNILLGDIESLKASLTLENNAENDNTIKDLEEQKNQLTATVMNLEDDLKKNKLLYVERTHYALQLNDQLNVVREESAIQMTKIKDFFECQKLKYTEYIQQLEKQLAESRAAACSEFKKRDHVYERLKNQIEILTKNLNEANIKIAEVANVKKLIENNSREELCRISENINFTCDK